MARRIKPTEGVCVGGYRPVSTVDFEKSTTTSPEGDRMSVPATPAGPYASKAVAAVVLAVTGVLVQWLATKGLNLDQEGVTAIVGAVVSFAVYQISNRRPLVGDSEPRSRSSWSNPA